MTVLLDRVRFLIYPPIHPFPAWSYSISRNGDPVGTRRGYLQGRGGLEARRQEREYSLAGKRGEPYGRGALAEGQFHEPDTTYI
jgi:hypothetical protein